MSDWQYELEAQRVYTEARAFRNSYFERLAILSGGAAALVITAVLGPLHGTIRHKYLLVSGLTALVLGMLILLMRNFLAAELELRAAWLTTFPDLREDYVKKHTAVLKKYVRYIRYSEFAGVILSGLGVVLLLVQVWLIL